ncbi:unnamed protein product [Sphenostylis stenocarpa]|uniref:Uncharacterized protein n=1 Tax=Sphenostylis stenocarpa TaxID=92480 RepID=A0AA86SQH3_9FABA|nr:unnamed protein product [Sphenostylis stenocarpa]
MADLLHHSPSFFKPPQNSTIFAIRDSAIRNTSHPLWFLKTLLLYHTTTYNPFSFHDLLNMSQGTCLTTLLRHKNISLTKVDRARNSVEINNVTLLKTLVPDEHLEIDGILDFVTGMVVNGVEIVAPDMITSEKFVFHLYHFIDTKVSGPVQNESLTN